ncbi:response regulator [Cohnella sp. WQ 127256]|uniref:response regulator n=1 Tax=Cohnella sp. WQ 127256 TaxID=2938790 RepID=UPI002118C4A8|nr:response regulator [Cohnella sp. WQ 127256]
MPKLLIVDDEETIRAGLTSMVNRLLPHWEVIGSCEDAEQAWEQVKSCSPDLAIIDIGMTGMSGLEFALRLNKEKPEVNKIMLTGYDKFSYIQTALRAGVTDYLLKPVQRDELVDAFGKVEELLAERDRQSRLRLEKTVSEWTINQKVGSMSLLEQLLDAEGLLDEDVRYGVILRFQCDIDRETADQKTVLPNAYWMAHYKETHKGILKTVDVSLSNVCEMTFVAGRDLTTLMAWLECREQEVDRKSVQLAPIGYGELVDDLRLLPSAFRQAQEMMYRNVQPLEEFIPEEEAERINRLIVAIEMNDLKLVNHLLELWQRDLRQAREHHPVWEFARLFRFVAFFVGLQASRTPSALLTGMNADITRLSGRLLFTGDPVTLLSTIDQFIENVALIKPDSFDERKIISKVKEMMRREYGNPDFSLEQAALFVHLNPTYLSELFKDTTGRKFIDYLTDIRLDEARRLLLDTDLKMYEVCLSVGYTSSKYFSTLFRKKFDVTPTMYRDGPGMETDRA